MPHESAAVSAQVLCTPYNHTPCHFMQSHIRKVCACLAVTCHLRFWQNDRDLSRGAAVTRGWNGYRNKSRHRKLTLEKDILPPLFPDSNPPPFYHESAQKVDPREENVSRRSCGDSNPGPFDHKPDALTTELSPLCGVSEAVFVVYQCFQTASSRGVLVRLTGS